MIFIKIDKFIENARLDDNSAKIVRGSIVKWEFNEAVTALKKIFGGDQSISSGESSLTGIKIKSEPQDVYYSSQYHKGQGRGSYSRGSYSRGSNNRGSNDRGSYGRGGYHNNSSRGGRYENNNSGCWICQSKDHFKRDCPRGGNISHYSQNKTNIQFVSESDKDDINYAKYFNILCYAENHAILDSGAPRNVVGQEWYTRYENSLDAEMKDQIVYFKYLRTFVFGEQSHSGEMKRIPLQILNDIVVIEV